MPKVNRNRDAVLNLRCDDPEDTFFVRYTNMGEPFRAGIEIGIENEDYDRSVTVMLKDSDAKQLRDVLVEHYPIELGE